MEIRLRDDCKYHLKLDKFIQRAKYQTPISDKPISAPVTIELSSVWSASLYIQPPSKWIRGHDLIPPEIREHFGIKEPEDQMLPGSSI